jgi:hypothetical protein
MVLPSSRRLISRDSIDSLPLPVIQVCRPTESTSKLYLGSFIVTVPSLAELSSVNIEHKTGIALQLVCPVANSGLPWVSARHGRFIRATQDSDRPRILMTPGTILTIFPGYLLRPT